jgi:hypothetical protein
MSLGKMKEKILFSNLWSRGKRNVVQIHDPKRIDRELLTKTWTRPLGISLHTFPALMNTDGVKGCFDSHVTLARTHPNPYYFVLEDDAVPTEYSYSDVEGVSELEQAIDGNVYDIIWLGGLPLPDSSFRFKTTGLLEGKCLTTYAMYVGPKAREYLAQLEFSGKPIDVVLSQSPLRTAYLNPPLFRQACTPSDIGKSNFTRGKVFASLLETITPFWRSVVIYRTYIFLIILLVSLLKFNSNLFS